MAKKQQENLPADVAKQDSLGGMAKRLLNPGHVAQLFGWAGRTVKEEGFEYLWRELDFRVSLAMHKDKWQHRADIPTGKQLKYQKAHPITGPKISVVVPMYNTPLGFLKEMM
ncbi:MAG: glycosyltransferase family 2 protein, partial [Oscillospiraceae bacterium]|nr:glycosyltransferase family 2 protein [Oscillospiraceae bacterium]